MDASLFEETELAHLQQIFTQHAIYSFGRSTFPDGSPLYSSLALRAAEDKEILRLVLYTSTKRHRPNTLFAAVQYLLFNEVSDELVAFYPNLTPEPRPPEEAYPSFRAFCLKHADEIRRLVTNYGVQTNEVGRCSDLVLAFDRVAQLGGDRSLAMLELGASAGLNMLWDHYGYDYGVAGYIGNRAAPVQLRCELRGDILPPLPQAMPVVIWRMGIDLNPIDVHDEGAARWLRALVWPEHRDRAQRLEAAIAMARQHHLSIVAGDAVDRLPEVLAQVPAEATLCIYHSYAMNQTPEPVRERIFAQIADAAKTRELFRVSEEWYNEMPQAELELFWYRSNEMQHEKLAECQGHGRWMKFVAP
ncbi:MAG TPA: DUF2332 domain-containing protein [Ktedonobacteraceae bacterium]|nr:DUF2332 domain-containing protein [Ktedonobacteraceae bacterium]